MNWEAIGAIGGIAGAMAVLVTLIYLSQQIRHSKQARLLASFQHTYDSLSGFCDTIAGSEGVASIVQRGRASFVDLGGEEQLRFEHVAADCSTPSRAGTSRSSRRLVRVRTATSNCGTSQR